MLSIASPFAAAVPSYGPAISAGLDIAHLAVNVAESGTKLLDSLVIDRVIMQHLTSFVVKPDAPPVHLRNYLGDCQAQLLQEESKTQDIPWGNTAYFVIPQSKF